MNSALCTLIIWGGMYYATPDWMDKQIPEWMWSRYEIIIYPYGTPLTMDYDPKTTGLIGFSAGGLCPKELQERLCLYRINRS